MATEQTADPSVDPDEGSSGEDAPNEIKSAPGISVSVNEGKRRAFSKAHAVQKLVHRTKKDPRAPKRPLSA